MTCSTDRYGATFVVAPSLGPPDCQVADFTDIQAAINALPPAGGKVFVKAGTYVVSLTIRVEQSNVHIQGEGMGYHQYRHSRDDDGQSSDPGL